MKKSLILAVILVSSCGKEDKRVQNCTLYGDHCHEQKPVPKETVVIVGPIGPQGDKGSSGHNTLLEIIPSTSCLNGGIGILSALDLNDSGLVDAGDSNIQTSEVCNGQNGQNGTDGQDGADGNDAPPSPFTPASLIDPCGDAPGIYDEVLLRLANNQILWSLSDSVNGTNTRFTIAVTGTWKTTDGSGCFFSIDANNNIYNEHY